MKIYLSVLLTISICVSVKAQTSIADSSFYKAMFNIEYTYWGTGTILHKVNQIYYETGPEGFLHDTTTIHVKVNADSFCVFDDSVERMQNGTYRIIAEKYDSILTVEPPEPFIYLFVNRVLFDNDFRERFVTGFTKQDSGTRRTLGVQFKNTCPFMRFYLTYDTSTYIIKQIEYRIKKGDYLTPANDMQLALVPEGFIWVRQVFAGGVTEDEDPYSNESYSTARFFEFVGGVFQPVAPFLNFDVINKIIQQ